MLQRILCHLYKHQFRRYVRTNRNRLVWRVSVFSEQGYMAESKVQSYLARPTNKLVTKRPETTKDIEINTPRLTPAQYESVLADSNLLS